MGATHSILLVDDSPGESELFRLAWIQNGTGLLLHTESDLDRAFKFLARSFQDGTLPSLVLLDLKLHNEHGLDLLRRLRADRMFMHLPVVVFTTSDRPADVAACYAAGANGYVVKPTLFEQLVRFVNDLSRYWITWNRAPHMVVTRC
ncbi:MAG TPA: response regulator [Nitrospiraceae bacterium]|nr:response regulator [Nitrospiraceae bacterium]